MTKKTSYEVRLSDSDRWFVEKVFGNENQAKAFCQTYLDDDANEYNAIQIVRVWQRADGKEVEKITLEERLNQRCAPVQLVPIDEAAPCAHRDDYLGLNARITVGRILRNYLEREGLIASELIYSFERTKRFMAGDLYAPCVDRIATLQAKDLGMDSRKRRDDIYAEVQKILDEVESLSKKKSFKTFDSSSLSEMNAQAKSMGSDLAFMGLVCKKLVSFRSHEGKLEQLLSWLESEDGVAFEPELDSLVAEVLSSPALITDMLGPQRNLAAAIYVLLDWVDGKQVQGTGAAPKCVEAICRLFKQDRLEATRDILFDFILRQLSGKQPLSRNDPCHEEREFMQLFARLAFPSGLTGGSDMAEALSRRYGRSLKQGGESGERMSIKWLLELLPNGATQLPYLLALIDAPLGQTHPDVVKMSLTQLINQATNIMDFSDADLSPRERLQCLKDLHILVEESCLDESEQKPILSTLDRVVEKYLIDTRLIDKLDNPDGHLRDRAIRMVQFVKSGVLWEKGHAMALARKRVVDHLKGANFVEKLTEGEEDPQQKEIQVRDFYKLLAEAGFKI